METKSCSNCLYFRKLYQKTEYHFYLYHSGACYINDKLTDQGNVCQCWKQRLEGEIVSLRILQRALKDLEEIR